LSAGDGEWKRWQRPGHHEGGDVYLKPDAWNESNSSANLPRRTLAQYFQTGSENKQTSLSISSPG
jgi:hypothetical protein